MADYDLPTGAGALIPYSSLPTTPGLPAAFAGLAGGTGNLGAIYNTLPVPEVSNPFQDIARMLVGFAAGTKGQANPIIEQEMKQREQLLGRQIALANMAQAAQRIELEKKREEREALNQKVNEEEKRDTALLTIAKEAAGLPSAQSRLFAGTTMAALASKKGATVPPGFAESFVDKPFDQDSMKRTATLLLANVPPEQVAQNQDRPLPLVTALATALQNNDPKLTRILTGKSPDELRLDALKVQEAEKELILKDVRISGVGEDVATAALQIVGPDGKKGHRYIDLPQEYRDKAADRAIANRIAIQAAGVANQPVTPQQTADLMLVEQQNSAVTRAMSILDNPQKFAVVKPFINPPLAGMSGVRRVVQFSGPEALVTAMGISKGPIPQELQDLYTAQAALRNIETKVRSGAAVSLQEERRLLGEIPTIENDKPELYVTKMRQWAKYAQVLDERTKRYMSVAGREALTEDAKAAVKAKIIREVPFEIQELQPVDPRWKPARP
jgi:hypothetical protein